MLPASSSSSFLTRYRAVLTLPGARAFFFPSSAARFGVAMLALATLWAVHGGTGSFARAGLATGAVALAEALVAPHVARLVDAYGQRRVLRWTLPIFVVSAAGLGFLAAGRGPLVSIIVLAGVAGGSCPQVGTLSAARWRHLVGDTPDLPAALSLEAAVNDVGFLIGPIVVTSLSATVNPALGLVLSVVLITVGTIVLLLRSDTEPPPHPRGTGLIMDRRLLSPQFAPFAAIHLIIGLYFGAIPVCLTAFALSQGSGALAGVMAAGAGVVSLLSGLAYGAVADRFRPVSVLIMAAVVLAVGSLGLSLVPTVGLMIPAYALVGGVVSLVLVPSGLLLQRAIPTAVYTQALTWTGSCSAAGIAVAAPVVGRVVESGTPADGFRLTAALVALLMIAVLGSRRQLRGSAGDPSPR